jgi:hypothetical protein
MSEQSRAPEQDESSYAVDGSPPPIQEAMRRVAHDIGRVGVGKSGVNRDQGYRFRSIDDVVTNLSPFLARHGVVILPSVTSCSLTERSTKAGGVMMYANLTVDYTIVGPRGDSLSARIVGLGSDTSDKATNKAMSAAFKYLLGQVFAIPQIGFNDADLDSPQIEPAVAEPAPRQQQRPASEPQAERPVTAPGPDVKERAVTRAVNASLTMWPKKEGETQRDRADRLIGVLVERGWDDTLGSWLRLAREFEEKEDGNDEQQSGAPV